MEGLHVSFKDAAKSNEGVIIQRCLTASSGVKTYCWNQSPTVSIGINAAILPVMGLDLQGPSRNAIRDDGEAFSVQIARS
eukprot:scaffold38730_cov53-Attheya_sp.AAC.6